MAKKAPALCSNAEIKTKRGLREVNRWRQYQKNKQTARVLRSPSPLFMERQNAINRKDWTTKGYVTYSVLVTYWFCAARSMNQTPDCGLRGGLTTLISGQTSGADGNAGLEIGYMNWRATNSGVTGGGIIDDVAPMGRLELQGPRGISCR